jgi:hypothetical protein
MKVVDGCSSAAHTASRISELVQSDKGVSINRMPGIEADMLRAWHACNFDVERVISQHPQIVHLLQQNTGFYSEPSTFANTLDTWCQIYIDALRQSSLLYRLETKYAAQNDYLVAKDLDEIHIWSANRLHQWLPLLENKSILVCTPFEDSVQNQYNSGNVDNLFLKGHIPFNYPKFELHTVKTHNTILGNTPFPHKNWINSLDEMLERVEKIDFDIAVLGCGGYGVPMCERIKSLGKKAIYVGSYCQIMFGIKGRRWENEGNPIGTYFNEYWVNPTTRETPKNFENVEGGCYW